MDLEQMKAKYAGQRVQFTGMFGDTDGPVAKVWRVTRFGLWVTMADGSRQQWHPESVTVVPASRIH